MHLASRARVIDRCKFTYYLGQKLGPRVNAPGLGLGTGVNAPGLGLRTGVNVPGVKGTFTTAWRNYLIAENHRIC